MLEYLNYSNNFLKEFVLLKVKVMLSKQVHDRFLLYRCM